MCLLVPVCASVFAPGRCSCAEPPANNALVIIEPGKAPVAAKKYITDNGGRISGLFSPNVFTGYVPAALDGELGAKHGAVIFRDEIADPAVLAKYGAAAVSAATVWNNNLELSSDQPPPSEKKHLKVILETDGTNFRIISKKVIKKARRVMARQPLAEGSYYVEALDASGRTLSVQSLDDPTKIYYDFRDESGAMRGGVSRVAKAQMVLRLPHDANIKTLRISRQKASVKGKSLKTEKPARLERTTDLEHRAAVDLGAVAEDSE